MRTTSELETKETMKSIAIITEFDFESVNYGNNLQAYALNFFFRKYYQNYRVETLLIDKSTGIQVTSWYYYLKRIKSKIALLLKNKENYNVTMRRKKFNEFAKNNIHFSDEIYSYSTLTNSLFDYYFVGSDIVWLQKPNFINKFKFLAFKPQKRDAQKIAYAASFGENILPKENKKFIVKYLSDFNMISVREAKSISFLDNIQIKGAVHVCDPTLLLTVTDWNLVANDISKTRKHMNREYAFVYILGDNKKEKIIKELCESINIVPLFIDSNNTYTNEILDEYSVNDCSPQEWIWLLKNAKYVFTDSFHGLIFATIFKKPFLVIKRASKRNLNVRLTDYLETIDELDKLVDIEELEVLDNFRWDYKKIDYKIKELVAFSKNFINESLKNNQSHN